MKAKQFLSQAYWLNQKIYAKKAQIEEYRDFAERITPVLSDMPKGISRGSRVADAAVKIADLQIELQDDIVDLIELKGDIASAIREVKNPEAEVLLELRYMAFKNWREIAEEMGYQMRNVFNIHQKALKMIKVPEKYR